MVFHHRQRLGVARRRQHARVRTLVLCGKNVIRPALPIVQNEDTTSRQQAVRARDTMPLMGFQRLRQLGQDRLLAVASHIQRPIRACTPVVTKARGWRDSDKVRGLDVRRDCGWPSRFD